MNFFIIFKVLLFNFVASKENVETSRSLPSFSLLEDRSINGNPLVEVNFADGSTDFLILSKYEGLDGHFIGQLQNEPTACVAMVNHPEHSELTIMSDRAIESTQYKWK